MDIGRTAAARAVLGHQSSSNAERHAETTEYSIDKSIRTQQSSSDDGACREKFPL